MRKSILLVLIFLMLGGLIQSPTMAAITKEGWEWSDIDLISINSTLESSYPKIATDPSDNFHLIWLDLTNYDGSGTDKDIFYQMFNASTQTWGNTHVISTESTNAIYYPQITCDNIGNTHVIWYEYSDYGGSGTDSDVFYTMKNATTQTWSTTEVISTESNSNVGLASIVTDSSNNIHVVWADTTDYGYGTDWDIVYQKYDFVSQTWSTTEVISTESDSHALDPKIACDLGGNIFVVWMDYSDYESSGTDYDIYFKRWDSKLDGWGITEVISTESTVDSRGPAIAVDLNNNIHIVWYDHTDLNGAGLDVDILYKKFDTYYQSWSDIQVVSTESTYSSAFPDIICNSRGIHVVWSDQSTLNGADSSSDIFYKYRPLDHSTWNTITYIHTIGSENSYFPAFAVDNSQFVHLVWSDANEYSNSGSDKDILYTKLSGLPDVPYLSEIAPNPSNGIINLEWYEVFSAQSYSVYRELYPIHSIEELVPLAETSNSYFVDELESGGTYYYAITANNPEGSVLSNTVYVQVAYVPETEFLNVTDTDAGWLSFPLSVPLIFGSITLIILIQKRRKTS